MAEIQSVFPKWPREIRRAYATLESEKFSCGDEIKKLGGTVKIGVLLEDAFGADSLVEELCKSVPEGKIIFGISDYRLKALKYKNIKTFQLGLEMKRKLQEKGRSVRFVTSREKVLSSVIVKKEKCNEFMILEDERVAKTCAVQEFEEYGFRDYGRPARDALSGMLPPKLAKIMVNLSQAKPQDILLDPFCGSGTILQEAILLGYKNIVGCDISEKAINDTKRNIAWISQNLQLTAYNLQLFQCDVRQISRRIKKADAIVTEPYLGPPLSGRETPKRMQEIFQELKILYRASFSEFEKILAPRARVVCALPEFHTIPKIARIDWHRELKLQNFQRVFPQDFSYSRTVQKVGRQILVLEKTEKYDIIES